MNVAADFYRGVELEEDGLGQEDLARGEGEGVDFGFEKVDLLAGASTTDLEEFGEEGVEVGEGGVGGRGGGGVVGGRGWGEGGGGWKGHLFRFFVCVCVSQGRLVVHFGVGSVVGKRLA